MLRQPRQLISAAIAILLGVAFVAATLVFSSSLNNGMTTLVAGQVGDAKVVVTPAENGQDPDSTSQPSISREIRDEIAGVAGVTDTRDVVEGAARMTVDGQQNYIALASQPQLSDETTMFDGRLATGDGEITLNKAAADAYHLSVGDQVTVSDFADNGSKQTVVGIVDAGNDAVTQTMASWVFAPTDQAMALTMLNGYSNIFVSSDLDAEQLRATIADLPGVSAAGLTVRTGQAEIDAALDEMTGDTNAIQYVLLGFATIALFVAVIVIANTFTILVAQRVRQMALLRCVGATKGQIFRSVFGEAALLGLVASVLGIGAGFGLAAALIPLAADKMGAPLSFSVSVSAVLVPLVVGVVITLAASISPARQATRVAPLAAMRPELAVGKTKRMGLLRLIAGLVLIAAGIAGLVVGITANAGAGIAPLVIAILGGIVSFVGVFMVGRGLIPAIARVLGVLPARSSVGGELAVGNMRRNPGRAAATANALLVGVTLITMLSVGASSAQASLDRYLGALFPQDATVVAKGGVSETDLSHITEVSGVSDAVLVPSETLAVSVGGERTVVGVDNDAAAITHMPSRYENLDATTVRTADTSISDGQNITLTGVDGQQVTLKASVSTDYTEDFIVSEQVLDQLAPNAPDDAWVQYDADANVNTVTTDLGKAVGNLNQVEVDSGAQMSEMFQQVIDIVLAVAIGLLAVAVTIAVIGVANTLALSVLERTQEIGLLRALGMTRRQVRSMISWEAVLIAVVAAILGLVMGTVYGLAGTKTLLAITSDTPFVAGLPWLRLAIIAVIAVGAGWLASLIPASRANRISPSAALATD